MRYCISDIHGCGKTLAALLKKINPSADDTVYFLGDYIDRGPDSKGVMDIVMGMPNAVCLKGNHEDFMIQAQDNQGALDMWMLNGGRRTLESFGWEIPEKYMDFCMSLPLVIELPDFYLCHSGSLDTDNPMNTPEDVLLWDRCRSMADLINGRRVVGGHTPTPINEIAASLGGKKIIIDNGCVYNTHQGYGNLLALCLDGMTITTQWNID